jgi:apolipoprotein D and lipocalin family protein
MKGTIAILISIAALTLTFGLKDKGDHEPWCNFPKTFKPTMKTADVTVDVARYMGTWYEVVRKGGDAF